MTQPATSISNSGSNVTVLQDGWDPTFGASTDIAVPLNPLPTDTTNYTFMSGFKRLLITTNTIADSLKALLSSIFSANYSVNVTNWLQLQQPQPNPAVKSFPSTVSVGTTAQKVAGRNGQGALWRHFHNNGSENILLSPNSAPTLTNSYLLAPGADLDVKVDVWDIYGVAEANNSLLSIWDVSYSPPVQSL
jgi:hypothetical protein